MHRPTTRRRREAAAAPPSRREPPLPPIAHAATALAGLGVLAGSAVLGRHDGARAPWMDAQVRRRTRWAQPRARDRLTAAFGDGAPGHPVALALAGVGGRWTTAVAAAAAAVLAARRRSPWHALPFLASFGASFGMHGVLKPVVRRPRPVLARLTGKTTPAFPSGHSARAAAVAGLVGYAAVAEGLARPRVVVPLVVAASIAGGGRVVTDRHWATDVVGGWGLGAAVAALCALWYDRLG